MTSSDSDPLSRVRTSEWSGVNNHDNSETSDATPPTPISQFVSEDETSNLHPPSCPGRDDEIWDQG